MKKMMKDPLSAMMRFISSLKPSLSSTDFSTSSDKLHVHFGAGRLGFGLVLPSLEAAGSPYVFVNRPSKVWAPVVEREREAQQHVSIQINGECACGGRGLHVITEDDIKLHAGGALGIMTDALDKGAIGFLLLSTDVDLIASVIARATSFSCALGPVMADVMTEHLISLPDVEDEARPVLYACENDHSAVEKLQFTLRTKVEAVPCMVDRICADLTVSEDATTVNVTAEGHEGSIVVLNQQSNFDSALAGDQVQEPENETDSSYLYRKKLLTVNGMHTVIAFRTLCAHAALERNYQPPDKCPALTLISSETITEEQRHELWSWSVAHILVLMWEHGLTTMMRVHKQDTLEGLVALLLDQMRATLDRFFNITDSTARVLGGGVSLRYEGRMVPVYQNLTNDIFVLGWTEGCAQEMLLEAAGLKLESLKSTLKGLIDEARPFAAVDKRVRATKALEDAVKDELSSLQIRKQQLRIAAASKVAVLFDFDGTLGDTETPAMEVAFWELAPYFPGMKAADLTPQFMREFIRLNAGKAFEFMLDKVEEDRAAAGLPPVEEVRSKFGEDDEVLQLVNTSRAGLGLRPFELTREEHKNLLQKQKEETVDSLRVLARPCSGVIKALNFLKISGFKFCISTTSPKPRVPVCVDTARLRDWFPDDKIHSGESDFNPPRFKPDPAVYLKAAAAEGVAPAKCIAVEDSASGVGSAGNALIGLIVGYVGASHITPDALDAHAAMLLLGAKSTNGIGADIVLKDMEDLPILVNHFLDLSLDEPERCAARDFDFSVVKAQLRDRCWLKAGAGGAA